MRMQAGLVFALVLAAGPAAAQGTFSPGKKAGSTFGSPASAQRPSSFTPPAAAEAPASKPRTYGAPDAPKSPGFEPYRPFKGSSVYSTPPGAKPCKTSVYIDACGKTR